MIIENGTIEFKTWETAAIDPETGYRQKPSSTASWGQPIPCQFNALKYNQLARVLGEKATLASYEVFVEEDTETPSEQVRLKDRTGRLVGEFSVIQVKPLDAVCEKRILV